jgi:hypothetical protein
MNIIRKFVFYVLNTAENREILNCWKTRVPEAQLCTNKLPVGFVR